MDSTFFICANLQSCQFGNTLRSEQITFITGQLKSRQIQLAAKNPCQEEPLRWNSCLLVPLLQVPSKWAPLHLVPLKSVPLLLDPWESVPHLQVPLKWAPLLQV